MLEFVIFVSGALVMIVEMVGARLMAPYLGTSVVVWTSLIGVVLACLALGAFIGGRLADKKLCVKTLSQILVGAGIGCVITTLAHRFVGISVTTSIDNIYISAVIATICLFAFPAILFGMVSPYIIRLKLADISTSGATVGRLYALSTSGSIVGTFLGGFVLISFFPSTLILLGVAATLFALALLLFVSKLNINKKAAQILPIILAFSTLPLVNLVNSSIEDSLKSKGAPPAVETPYNSIRITEGFNQEQRPVRYMATDPGFAQSGTYLDNVDQLLFDYTKYYSLGTVLFPKSEKVLMLGGGGYSVPKWLLAGHGGLDSANLRLDVVELDPGMTKIAKKSFGLVDDARMRIFHEDARRFINKNKHKYDLIFVDVFNSHYSIPFHMGTVEAAQALYQSLNVNGALLMNVIAAYEGEGSEILQSIHGSLSQSFSHVYVFAVTPYMPRTAIQNFMILALPNENKQVQAIIEGKSKQNFSAAIMDRLKSLITTEINAQVPSLRDDFAPVEKYAQALLKK